MKTFDLLRGINHILSTSLGGKTLMRYKLPGEELQLLPVGHVRIWTERGWLRVSSKPESPDSYAELPEVFLSMLLGDRLLDMEELFLCWDQASWDVSCGQFLLEPPPGALATLSWLVGTFVSVFIRRTICQGQLI